MTADPVLSGIRLIELTTQLSGPYGGMLLADLGADVVKVESPHLPDPARSVPSVQVDGQPTYYLSLNRNKRSVCLDLKQPAGHTAFLALVDTADVVLDNFRPGVTARLGVGHDSLAQRNPSIITCSVSGFGETGPYRDRPGYDYLIQALAGTMSLTGDPGGPPTKYGISVVDHVGGLFAALGISSALVARELDPDKRGRHIDVSLMDSHLSMLSYLASGVLNGGSAPVRQPMSAHPSLVPNQLFETSDDYIIVMTLAPHFFPTLCEAIGMPELVDDPRFIDPEGRLENREDLVAILSRRLLERTTDEWLAVLEEHGLPVAPVQTVEEALRMEQVQARDMVVDVEHPAYGSYRAVGNPLKISGSGPQRLTGAPVLGEHTAELLREAADMSDADIDELRRQGVI